MNELDDVEFAGGGELVDHLHQLRRAQAEFRFLAARLRPPSAAFCMELDAHASPRRHAHLGRHLQQHVELAHLLDHDEHIVPEPLPHQGETHELFVFIPVADNQVVGAFGECQHSLKLRLGTAFESNAGRLAKFDNLFDHVPLLVDLDRIYGGISACVFEFPNRMFKAPVQCFDA